MTEKNIQDEYNKSAALMAGAKHNEINNPNWMAKFQETGDVNHAQSENSKGGGSGRGSCFVAETPILTPSGWISIGSLSVGDVVLSVCCDSFRLIPRKILRKKKAGTGRIWQINTSCGRNIRTTKWHTFLANDGWSFAWRLHKEKEILLWDGAKGVSSSTISKSGSANASAEVFNLVTDGERNFIANGFIAHNFSFARRLRSIDFGTADTGDLIAAAVTK